MGGRIGGKRSLETMTPEERSERAKKAAAASAEARRNRGQERLRASSREPEASRSPTPKPPVVSSLRGCRTKKEALTFADQVLSGLHGYARKGSRKRRDFYRNDLQWLTDVLVRVDAGEGDALRPTGQLPVLP
jgi:hypothetical protein